MTVLIGSSLTGLEADKLAIEEPIRAADVRVALQDQAYAYERTTGLKADQAGTTASVTNAAHRHNHSTSTDGTLLYRQFAAGLFGTPGPNGATAAENYLLTTYANPVTITETSSTSDTDNMKCLPILFYVPSGWVNKDILLLIDCSGDPDMSVTLYDSTLTPVTGYENLRISPPEALVQSAAVLAVDAPQIGAKWGAVLQAPSAGVYAIICTTNLRQNGGTRIIYGFNVVGVCDVSRGIVLAREAWAQTYSGTAVQVGDPDASNAWQPIDDMWCPSGGDSPLHVGLVQKMNENAALTWEKATGLPAPGNAALTITRGHTHSGAAGEGPEIGVAHVACNFGFLVDFKSVTEFTGNKAKCPNHTANNKRTDAVGAVYMPRSANTSTGASKVRSAVLVYVTDLKGAKTLQVDLEFGADVLSFNSAATGTDAFQILTTPTAGSNAYAFTENASNVWSVRAARTAGGAGDESQVCAVLFYTTE